MFMPGPMEMIILGLICVIPVVGVIVVLIVVFATRRGTPPTGASLSPCPDCGQAVSIAATTCPNCGCHLPTQPDT